jgi:hypothetical protein
MPITTVEEAFRTIEKRQSKVPFEAIEFLHQQPTSAQITDKLVYYIANAYNEALIYNKKLNYYSNAPLWYAVVAEEHLSKQLVQAVVEVFTSEKYDDWDYLNEQITFLVGKLCQALGAPAINAFLEAILASAKTDRDDGSIFFTRMFVVRTHPRAASLVHDYRNFGAEKLSLARVFFRLRRRKQTSRIGPYTSKDVQQPYAATNYH